MITGAHTVIYSTNAEADRAFFRDIIKLPNVDAGDGWLIFGLPPGEVAVHPSEKNDMHEFFLMCEDMNEFLAEMRKHDVAYEPAMDLSYGRLAYITLPGGGKLGVYEPRHARP
jgi:hypothetical protein